MRYSLIKSLLTFFIALLFTSTSYSQWIDSGHTKVRLLSEYQTINSKSPFWVLVQFDIQPGWHTYWQNPGDSGTPPNFQWQLPEGWEASKIHWLPPQKIPAGPFVNYGYSRKAYHLIKITPKPESVNTIIQIELHANWLVCDVECVPEEAVLVTKLRCNSEDEPSDDFDKINTLVAKTKLPKLKAMAMTSEDTLQLFYKSPKQGDAYFFPKQKGIIEPAKQQMTTTEQEKTKLSMVRGSIQVKYPVLGVLKIGDNNFSIDANEKAISQAVEGKFWLPLMLGFALLGGLILNLMPCVFPVLSLKVLTLQASSQKILQGVFYTLGIVLSFMVIAAMLLVLQSLGTQVGWGFQLQSPSFVISLIFIFTLISMNLFGLFEIPFSLSKNPRWVQRHKLLYAFLTGVLACVVATPCSAPFMATAIGVALTQNAIIALLIFIFLGLGLALPYLLIAIIPSLANKLPKPGHWMETTKQLLAFPMILSVIWLLWVLGQQKSFDAIILLLLSLTALLFLFWLRRHIQANWWKKGTSLIAVGLIIWPLFFAWKINGNDHHSPLSSGVNTYTQEILNKAIAQREKVFVYATAAWCITCKINEKVALKSTAVKDFFRDNNIKVLKADWTNRDETILHYLQKFGRAGVPLYVYYQPGKPPKVLPQLLTPGIIIKTIKGE